MTGPQILAVPQKAPAAKTVRLDAVLKTSWGRLLVPSLTDLFFIAVMSWLFLAGEFGWKGLLNDADAGWHIRTGEYILDTGVVPRNDLFSFSKPGEKWFAWEWGSDVLMALLHRAGGLKALVLAAATLITLFAALLLRRIAGQGVSLWVMVPVAMLGVGASSLHFLARPHLFTMLFLVITAWLVESDRRRRTPWIWVLAPLTAVWVNLHGGFPAGIAGRGIAGSLPVARDLSAMAMGANPSANGSSRKCRPLHTKKDSARAKWTRSLKQKRPRFEGALAKRQNGCPVSHSSLMSKVSRKATTALSRSD